MLYRTVLANRALLLAGAAIFCVPTSALAQDQQPPENQASTAASPATPEASADDEAIVVTARRTEENVQRVPGAITAFSDDQAAAVPRSSRRMSADVTRRNGQGFVRTGRSQ